MADMMIPEGWSVKTLSALAFIDRKSLSGKTDPNFQFKYIDIASVKTAKIDFPSNYISFKEAPSRARRCVQMGDVLMSTVRPNLQSFAYFDKSGETFVASTGFAVITAKKISCGKFLYYSILSNSVARQIEALVVGSNYPAINSADVKNLEILEPPLPEQQKIATILTSVDTVIEKTRAQIDKLKDLKTGMMQELLTKGIGHTEFKDTPIGRIPKAWEVVEFSKLAECKPKKYNPLKELKKLPCIELEHIEQESGRILGYISSSEVISIKNKFSSEDVLFSKLRPYLKKFAFPKHDGVCTPEIWVFTPRKEVTSLFLFYVVQSEKFLAAANKSCGTKMPRAELDAVLETFFTKPPVKEQQKIASILQSVDDKIAAVNQKLASLEKTKKAMMQDLLTGKVRVI